MKTIKSILVCTFALLFILNVPNDVQAQLKGYVDATYSNLSGSSAMQNWLVLGPIKIKSNNVTPTEEEQKAVFEKDILTSVKVNPKNELAKVTIGDTSYTWKSVKSKDGIIDFFELYDNLEYATAYALAELKMNAPAKVVFGVGSDDAIKIFLNGELVHSNWIGRGLTPDDDIVILNLKKGSNQLLIKVQNMQYGWGFTMRNLEKEALGDKFIESASSGNLDNLKLLINNGVDINYQTDIGLSAYHAASIAGRQEVLEFLKEKGAKADIPMPAFDKLVSNIFKSAQSGTTPGVAILVSQDGKIIYENCFGYADVGNKVKVSLDTKFRIGSITKQFIASSILKLQEEGKLSVNDKLAKYYPEFPKADEVTIHHLLTHTSGIHSYTNRPGFLKYTTMPILPEALVDTIQSYPYDFEPGEQYLYNNSGFFILGRIVSKVSDVPLKDYLKQTFFDPLGMNSTGIYQTDLLLENEAYGYAYENDTLKKALNWDMSWAGGAGALYSTVKDLYKWNEAVFNGKVLSDKSLEAAFTKALLNNKETIDYGYGWGLGSYRGVRSISHGGGLHGFLSMILREPVSKTNIIVLCNSTPPPDGINPGSNAFTIAEYLLWKKMEKQSSFSFDVKVDEKTLEKYVGKYDYGQAVMIITLEEGKLYAKLGQQPKFPIFATSQNEFRWKVVEASIKFVADDSGKVTHAIHNQGGQQFEVKKIEE